MNKHINYFTENHLEQIIEFVEDKEDCGDCAFEIAIAKTLYEHGWDPMLIGKLFYSHSNIKEDKEVRIILALEEGTNANTSEISDLLINEMDSHTVSGSYMKVRVIKQDGKIPSDEQITLNSDRFLKYLNGE